MSAILNSIEAKLAEKNLVKANSWATEIETWGARVALYRDYIDGKHRLEMTSEMAKMLRIDKEDDERFSINYADAVVTKMVDRLHIERIEHEDETANTWVEQLLEDSEFNELQIGVTSDAIADGDTFVIIAPTKDGEPTRFIHEPSWDGVSGIIPVYDIVKRNLAAVVKVWENIALDKDRVNIYYNDRIEKYIDDGGLKPWENEPEVKWIDGKGKPLGIPFGHFRNRKKTRNSFGKSEIQKIIAPQDVLNRTFVSMTMTSELTAFQRLAFIGMTADADISPGAIWEIVQKNSKGEAIAGIPNDRYVDIKVIEPGEITPFVNQAQFTIEQISVISDTPIPSVMGGDVQSGEALKQREVGLVAKAKTAQIVFGNVWKALVLQAREIDATFGGKPPEFDTANVVWSEIEMRDTTQTVTNVVAISDFLDKETVLKEVEPVMDFSIADIGKILDAKKAEAATVANAARRQATLLARQQARNIPPETGNGQTTPPEIVDTSPPINEQETT